MVVGYKDFIEELKNDIEERTEKIFKGGMEVIVNFQKDPEKWTPKMHDNLRQMGYVDALEYIYKFLKNNALGYDMEDLKEIEKNYDESTSENSDNNVQ